MRLRSKATPNTGERNIHVFNLECPDREHIRTYRIGPDPVEVPDADGKRIVAMHSGVEVVNDHE